MSLIITFMFEPAKLQTNCASASGTRMCRREPDGRPTLTPSATSRRLPAATEACGATSAYCPDRARAASCRRPAPTRSSAQNAAARRSGSLALPACRGADDGADLASGRSNLTVEALAILPIGCPAQRVARRPDLAAIRSRWEVSDRRAQPWEQCRARERIRFRIGRSPEGSRCSAHVDVLRREARIPYRRRSRRRVLHQPDRPPSTSTVGRPPAPTCQPLTRRDAGATLDGDPITRRGRTLLPHGSRTVVHPSRVPAAGGGRPSVVSAERPARRAADLARRLSVY